MNESKISCIKWPGCLHDTGVQIPITIYLAPARVSFTYKVARLELLWCPDSKLGFILLSLVLYCQLYPWSKFVFHLTFLSTFSLVILLCTWQECYLMLWDLIKLHSTHPLQWAADEALRTRSKVRIPAPDAHPPHCSPGHPLWAAPAPPSPWSGTSSVPSA